MDSKEQERIMALTRRNMEGFTNRVQILTDIYKRHPSEPAAHVFPGTDGVLIFGAFRGRLKDGRPVLVMRCPLCGDLHAHAAVNPGFGENDHAEYGHLPDRPLKKGQRITIYRLKEVFHPRLAGF